MTDIPLLFLMHFGMHKGAFVKIAINKEDICIFSECKQKNIILDGMCWIKVEVHIM